VPLRLGGRDLRVLVFALVGALAFALLAAATVAAWQHRTLAYAATTLDAHDQAALRAPPPPQVVNDAAANASLTLPVRSYRVGARFGQRGEHWATRHTGFDFVASTGTPVRAVQAGVILKLAWNGAYGRMIILKVSPDITLWYCHLSAVGVKVGQHVTAGQTIGRVGMTGNTTGPHLHLEVRVHDRPTDPEVYLFGPKPGTPGPSPRWYPHPGMTVALLQPLRGH
jgi:murein DD-endopeptidase MepM/ murein hydrolase activator NlpD